MYSITMKMWKCGHVFQIICIYGRKCCCSWRRGCRSMTVTAIQCSSGRGGPGESRRGLNRAQRMGCTLTWLLSTLRWFLTCFKIFWLGVTGSSRSGECEVLLEGHHHAHCTATPWSVAVDAGVARWCRFSSWHTLAACSTFSSFNRSINLALIDRSVRWMCGCSGDIMIYCIKFLLFTASSHRWVWACGVLWRWEESDCGYKVHILVL